MKQLPRELTVDELQQVLANKARLCRLAKGFTQSELSRQSQVSYASIRKFERTGEISLHSLLKIAKTLDEAKYFQSLFHSADFFKFFSPKVFKRPKLHSNGTYHSTRVLTPSQLSRQLDFEDNPHFYLDRNAVYNRSWKNSKETELKSKWDSEEEWDSEV